MSPQRTMSPTRGSGRIASRTGVKAFNDLCYQLRQIRLGWAVSQSLRQLAQLIGRQGLRGRLVIAVYRLGGAAHGTGGDKAFWGTKPATRLRSRTGLLAWIIQEVSSASASSIRRRNRSIGYSCKPPRPPITPACPLRNIFYFIKISPLFRAARG
jgi:hypothetical protein